MLNLVPFKVLLFTATCCQLCSPFVRHISHHQGSVDSPFSVEHYDSPSLTRTLLNDAKKQPEIFSVRSSILKSIANNLMAATAALAVLPTVAKARQGAFEMDVEYYLKTVASRAQGKPDATIDAKTAKPAFASARVIDKNFATSIGDIVIAEISRVTKLPVSVISMKVNAQLQLYLPYFKEFVPITSETFSDQYYFDITLYASYIVAAQLIPKSTDRVILRKNVGDSILDLLIKKNLVKGTEIEIPKSSVVIGESCSSLYNYGIFGRLIWFLLFI